MNKKFYSIIVIFYTLLCIYIMINYKVPNGDVNKDITLVKKQQEQSGNKNTNISDQGDKANESLKYNAQDTIQGSNTPEDVSAYSREKARKIIEDSIDEAYKLNHEDSGINEIKGEFDSFNIEQRKRNQVIKVPVEEIVSCLSFSEKGKLLTISRKLSKEDYTKFEEYLGYKNQKYGMRKALEIIEQKLPVDEVEEVKTILSKIMDMEIVESGN